MAVFFVVLAALLVLLAWGAATRRAAPVGAAAGGLFGLGLLTLVSFGAALVLFAVALLVVAALGRRQWREADWRPRALAAAATASATAAALVVLGGLGAAALDPCFDIVWTNDRVTSGSATSTPDDPCTVSGTAYASVEGTVALALALVAAPLALPRRTRLLAALALVALGLYITLATRETLLVGGPVVFGGLAAAWALREARRT